MGTGLTVGMAYGRTNSIVDVAVNGGGDYAYVKSANNASDRVSTNIENLGFDVISATALYGAAYSQDVFSTKIQLTGGDYDIAGDVDVKMDYDVNGLANVEPSSRGVNVGIASLAANIAMAKNTAYAGTDFEMSIGTSHVGGNLEVNTQGSAKTDAQVQTANLSVTGASLTANKAKSNLSMTQAAVLRAGGTLTVDGKVDVRSTVKNGEDGSAAATASVGSFAGKNSLNLSLANLDVSRAIARENMSNSALILGAASGTEDGLVPVTTSEWETQTHMGYDYDEVESVTYTLEGDGFNFSTTTKQGDAGFWYSFCLTFPAAPAYGDIR